MVSGQAKATLEKTIGNVTAIAYSPDGKTLVFGSSDNSLLFYDLPNNRSDLQAIIQDTEEQVHLSLDEMALQPKFNFANKNHYNLPQVALPQWPKENPFHWLSRSENRDSAAMLQLGICYDLNYDLEKAKQWYQMAAEAGEKEAKSRLKVLAESRLCKIKLAADHLWMQRPQHSNNELLSFCNRVIRLDPDHIDALWLRGKILYQQKEFQMAEQDFRKVCRLAPAIADAFGFIGWLLITQNRFQEATPFCQKAHTLDPDNFTWTTNLGHLHLFNGDSEKAYSLYRAALDQIPDSDTFENGPVADFGLFISNGWHVNACQKVLSWMRQEYAELSKR
jgi:tetratricopeptide (TPR) repeat protein